MEREKLCTDDKHWSSKRWGLPHLNLIAQLFALARFHPWPIWWCEKIYSVVLKIARCDSEKDVWALLKQGGLAAGEEKEKQCPGSHWVLSRLGRWWPLTTHPTCSDSALLLPTIHCAAGPTCHRQVQVQGPFAGKRATAGLHSKGSFTTSGKIARNPNFFLALGE